MSEGGKRSAQQSSGPVSPKKYILTRARSLPISACYINRNWKDSHMAEMIIVRKHKNANVTAGFYLVDLLAHGVKDTHFVFNEPEPVFNENVKGTFPEGYLEKTSYALAHNIIYGAVEFAADHGYKAHKDFSLTRHILEDDTDEIELIDIEFGIKGQPSFLRKAGPDDQAPFDETGQDDLPVFYSYSDEDWK
ncbi:MAG TPA: hypothetical protein VI583_04295, partial [Cyclobacteriaceae bacterium]|nr:hypothetical protein [Cyclobacteriaceae bacterium]